MMGSMKRIAMIGVTIGLLASCGGSNEDETRGQSTTTTPMTTTTTTLSSDDAFVADIRRRTGWTVTEAEASLDLVSQVCDTLSKATTGMMLDDDAANDSPQTDASIATEFRQMAIGVLFSEYTGPDDLLAEILTVGAEHLCPDQTETITNYISSIGLTIPG